MVYPKTPDEDKMKLDGMPIEYNNFSVRHLIFIGTIN